MPRGQTIVKQNVAPRSCCISNHRLFVPHGWARWRESEGSGSETQGILKSLLALPQRKHRSPSQMKATVAWRDDQRKNGWLPNLWENGVGNPWLRTRTQQPTAPILSNTFSSCQASCHPNHPNHPNPNASKHRRPRSHWSHLCHASHSFPVFYS